MIRPEVKALLSDSGFQIALALAAIILVLSAVVLA
jgi:hypothetical protein